MPAEDHPAVVIGVDVGGPRKGFHLVALRGASIEDAANVREAAAAATWCRSHAARVIAIDAPSCWSPDGRARRCERELATAGIRCFPTPTESAARSHPTGYFDWMLQGMELYDLLAPTHPRLGEAPRPASSGTAFETFPHAITCELSGRIVAARDKRAVRLELLRTARVDASPLRSMDAVDAAVCALAARAFAASRTRVFGAPGDGFIVVPRGR